MSAYTPAGWYPDPFGRHHHRYWDGAQWTHHVGSEGRQGFDPPLPSPPQSPVATPAQPAARADAGHKRVKRQVAQSFGVSGKTDAALLHESVLVVNQKAKLGAKTEYAVHDKDGRRIGTVQEVGSALLRMATGAGGRDGTRKFQIVDPAGTVVIALHRPAKLLKSKVIVVGADGVRSEIVQKNLGILANFRFSLESGGRVLGTLRADDHSAWEFTIQDSAGREVARITKTWAGWAKEWFTTADHYVVQIQRQLEEPMRSLVVAAALAVDTALKEDDDNWRRGSLSRRRS